ncbi:Uncharacterised protein [Mycobacterium tuberculosis]|uniref:Uncharacterized protein n=1 Tax=Mycobacterium tuberculosis TaxID=1773 RepID=A0A655I9K2_MYCTX|nr:Uncharacterised protein [Mycobacterium tuberculosis]COV67526.1 Uncharacterised protein [Mycobacterium tuberculosis]
MSVRLPPHVELSRDGTANTLSATSSTRRPAITPHTCVFLPNATMSGATSNCWYAQAVPVNPQPVCTSSKISSASNSSHSSRIAAKNSGRKWRSPPSPWMGSATKHAMSCGRVSNAARAWRSASASSAAIAGSSRPGRMYGASMRGQSNFGNRAVMVGLVLVSDRV